jgi:hypothetical protein
VDAAPSRDAGEGDAALDAMLEAALAEAGSSLDAGSGDATSDANSVEASAADAGTNADAGSDASRGDAGDSGTTPPHCDVVLELRAHAAQTLPDSTAYVVPTGSDHYEVFSFAPSWDTKLQVIGVEPLIDNPAVVASWHLYMSTAGSAAVGSHAPGLGLQSAANVLLAQWAPGAQMAIPPDIGLQVVQGSTARFSLQVHYIAITNTNREDRSGVRLCLTQQLRSKEAALHWLGTQAIVNVLPASSPSSRVSFSGVCTSQNRSHIVGYAPHMHRQGRRMKIVLERPDTDLTQVITDLPFSFEAQSFTWFSEEILVEPEDVLTTTCSYAANASFTFGPGLDDEQCYAFVFAWPAGSLSNGKPGVVGDTNACIDGF